MEPYWCHYLCIFNNSTTADGIYYSCGNAKISQGELPLYFCLLILYNVIVLLGAIQNREKERNTMAYKDMLDSAFAAYYDRFRKLNALSKENAVTREELFPDGETIIDADRMHKMLSMDIVRRVGMDRYWLDEKRASDGKGVLKQRIIMIVIAIVIGLTIGILSRMGILNF